MKKLPMSRILYYFIALFYTLVGKKMRGYLKNVILRRRMSLFKAFLIIA
jgi:hypothetical protein